MILALSLYHQRKIACIGAIVIYCQLLLPLFARAEYTQPKITSGYILNTNNIPDSYASPVRNDTEFSKKETPLVEQQKFSPKQEFNGGPGQLEMSSFQSVNGSNMVDLFTGDFSYNIPLLDVGGYPVNIHYSSGITMDQEASWVGLGWNINPGTIARNMRGLPDDFNGTDVITKTLNIKQNKTIGVKLGAQAEMAGFPLTVGASLGVFHNNYNGWGVEQSVNAAISMSIKNKGDLTSGDSTASSLFGGGNFGITSNSQTGLSISKSLNVSLKKMEGMENMKSSNFGISTNYHTRGGIAALTIDAYKQRLNEKNKFEANGGVSNVNISFAQPSITPSISIPTTSNNYMFHLKTGGEVFGFHGNVFVQGYVNKQVIKKEDRTKQLPAYGYIHYSTANNNPDALLDFNREKEVQFNYKSTPNLAIPQYTYDVYSMSGEGTGGTIRPYRGDIGYIRDHHMRTKSADDQFSFEIGGGQIIHTGFSYDFVRAFTENSEWSQRNNMRSKVAFQRNNQLYESVYFRNPGERTTNDKNYFQKFGGDALVRVKLDRSSIQNVSASNQLVSFQNGVKSGEISVNNAIRKEKRDKRSQVVTYLNALEASEIGLDKTIRSYKENTLPIGACADTIEVIERVDAVRKAHHLSQIDVLNSDGRRYVYGLPAYNVLQKDVTFAVKKNDNQADIDKGLVSYSGKDNTEDNEQGKDNYFNREVIPPYAHTFLLTGILSPDYVDIKGDGITEDDLGDAVRFNYSRIYGPSQGYFQWRTPGNLGKANFNEGLKTYSRDDKGSYFFGEKEVWYTHSIESKTMVAVFMLGSDRVDAQAAENENGGHNSGKQLRRLDRIELYAKADLLKNGQAAKPVKTVHFEYSYDLCKGYNGNSQEGKLTLTKIWFSYNGNKKGKQNPYVFNYTGLNPTYHPKHSDRWANYKNPANNPGSLSNADYPYSGTTIFSGSDSARAAMDAGAWHLNEIILPAGAKMKITYESDDYAFVQNKRATQFTAVAGFGSSSTATPASSLYSGGTDFDYVFINSPVPIIDKKDIQQKYLEGIDWLYLKLAVVMPADKWGSGYEFVPVYAKITDWGKVAGQNQFWLKLEKVQGVSPLLRSALQFLRNNLPSKAYPTSELGDEIDLGAAVKMLLSHSNEVRNAVSGFEKASMQRGWCKEVNMAASHIRLNAPEYKKLGGGLRVKRVEVYDNWSWMTNQQESVYGQEYQYRTSIKVNGVTKLISSGVASYEPMIGNEENPFRQPIPYAEKMAPLAPVTYLYSEMPLGESYFPGASVGYSKVRVRTIHTKAKSANGWEEKEFFTTKDFPTLVEHTLLDQDAKARFKPKLLNLLKVYSVDRTTVSQGFKIELNDMNGKPKSSAFYSEADSLNPISYSRNYYKVENENASQLKLNNSVWVVDSANGIINPSGIIGKDIEFITDFRQQKSTMTTGGLSPNLDYFQIGIFPIPLTTFFKFPQYDETQFRSVAVVKVIQRYGILDSIVVMDKGSVVSTKNLLYDGETGEVLLSRTNNEFNDPIYNFSYPAHWAYSGMGMAYQNIHAEFQNIKLINGKAYYPSGNIPYPVEQYFESGDELLIQGRSEYVLSGAACFIFVPFFSKPLDDRAWVVDAAKGVEKHKGLYFIDKNGKPITATISKLKIIRSGKRNILNASAGSLVSMDNPIREISPGVFRLKIDSTLRIVNASVNSYGDLWQVENGLFVKDTVYRVVKKYTKNITPTLTSRRTLYTRTGNKQDEREERLYGIQSLVASYNYIRGGTGCYSRAVRSKSIVQFDLSDIPSTATIDSAFISFTGRKPEIVWKKFRNDCSRKFESYDWSTANSYWEGNSGVKIRRIISPWSSSTQYRQFSVSSTSVSFGHEDIDKIAVKSLLQESVSNPLTTFGFMIDLEKSGPSDNRESEINYLSLCANSIGSTGLGCGGSGSGSVAMLGLTAGCNCSAPSLFIDYTVVEDSLGYVCRYNINDSAVNPYRWGLLGNWRVDSVYSYYSDRNESIANTSLTNIRQEGLLKNFQPYWIFDEKGLVAKRDTTRWVWNSAMNGYNRKGFEIENFDPLGRYNAGLYGYNQSLPTAVSQNARYQELLSDGFEDYSYSTDNCTLCKQPREIDFIREQTGVSISSSEAHTGIHSMQVNAGAESKVSVPVLPAISSGIPKLSIKVDSTPIYTIDVVGRGTGLSGQYEGFVQSGGICTNQTGVFSRIDSSINFSWGNASPHPSLCIQNGRFSNAGYYVTWTGKIQAKVSGKHRFYLAHDGAVGMSITKGSTFISLPVYGTRGKAQTGEIDLVAGELYDIMIRYNRSFNNFSRISLSWSSEYNFAEEIIPKSFLYPANMVPADTVGSVQRNIQYYCIKLNNTNGQQLIRPTFSPMQNARVVVSAWVKMGGPDCNTAPALENVIRINFNNQASGEGTALVKTGVRIDGWQRYEAVVLIPGSASQLNVITQGVEGRQVFVDDVRVQPYNSALKAFVYDPVSLRLMADLDENNYASFYEYDDDGTLIRVKKETEKGIMTIRETRSALIKDMQ